MKHYVLSRNIFDSTWGKLINWGKIFAMYGPHETERDRTDRARNAKRERDAAGLTYSEWMRKKDGKKDADNRL